MNDAELGDALVGLFAYDEGAHDSGIHDERLRLTAKDRLFAMSTDEFRLFISRLVREQFLSEEALAQRYGLEDVKDFIRWLSQYMDFTL